MYVAKRRGIGSAVYSPEEDPHTPDRLELLAELRRALDHEEFRVYYQPIVDLKTGRTVEAEALVRWQHPQRGLIPPAEFIPLAEEAGLIVPLGRWVLQQACWQARDWQARLPGVRLVIGVNLSARQFQQPGLAEDVAWILRQTKLEPACLKLEITEGVAMDDAELTVATLHRLKATGVRIAIDDFGTGYSSLSYLKRFPVDTLKVDKAFVDGVARSTEDAGIVEAIVAFARTLGLSTTAEGIEDAEQFAALRALGCALGQGYHFARPLPAEEMAALLAGSRVPTILSAATSARIGPAARQRTRPAA
jgi:EAL domain-containing protein (putative c-di-GMP-specific phosphodiesterase class I)